MQHTLALRPPRQHGGDRRLRRTIFIIDDEEIVRVALTRLLQAEGYVVQSYASASAFLEAYAGCEEGCVISDLAMPGLNGLELQSALAATARPLPVIFISGYGTVPSSVQAMKQGAVDFLTKPVKDVDLLRAIKIRNREGSAGSCHRQAGRGDSSQACDLDSARARSVEVCLPRAAQQADRRRSRDRGKDHQSAPRPRDGKDGRALARRARSPVRTPRNF